ncbi:phosphoethanolamine transferase [Prevotella sp. E13-17]|uniref:phosphoethanolamine transferase n=1 Tax=Prevotella sp. E13-17 TaxID=2913616 RepID=UPI001EDBCF67|nr:phosphoethanolamine transferase [Prevotella sp. E13-17]UKK51018.1 phosphoethanolamine transferase [Prevotella sp. E13-17]
MVNKKAIKKFLGYILRPVEEEMVFFLFMYMLGAVCILFEPWGGCSRFWSFFELLFDVYVLSALLCALPKWMQWGLKGCLYPILYLTAMVDMALYYRTNSPIVPILLQMALQSNVNETTEAIGSYADRSLLWSPLMLIVALLSAHICVGIKRDWREKLKHVFRRFMQTRRATLGGSLLLLLLISGWSCTMNKKILYYNIIEGLKDIDIEEKIGDDDTRTGFYVPIYRLLDAVVENMQMKQVIEVLHENAGKGEATLGDDAPPHVVLILGESYNKYHSHLYGYELPTTPSQDSLMATGRLAVFSDAISSWNATCESFQSMFSMYCVGDRQQWYEYPFFTTLMRNAGYQVAFLSNQFVMDCGASYSSFVEDLFINDRLLSSTQFDYRNDEIHPYDLGLVNDYRRLKQKVSQHNLWIFHFMGLHADFHERYPESWQRFTATDYDRPDLKEADLQILADYDNAILYNDYVIKRIIDEFKDKDALIVFVADHGERVYDDCQVFGRNLTWNPIDIKSQFSIPFWIYATPKYCEHHQDDFKAIQAAQDKRYMTDAIGHTLLRLAGVKTPYYRAERDVVSPRYDENRKRIIREERDFDEIIRN